jgi:hypothetical protein
MLASHKRKLGLGQQSSVLSEEYPSLEALELYTDTALPFLDDAEKLFRKVCLLVGPAP